MEIPTYTKAWHSDVYPAIDASQPALSSTGKSVLITGGGSGIGAATAEAFAVAGAKSITLLGRTVATLSSVKTSLTSKHPSVEVLALVADVSDDASLASAFDTVTKQGPIDIFVNNAAFLSDLKPLNLADIDEWWRTFEVNVRGSLQVTKHVLDNISKDGVIINVSSGAAHLSYVPGNSSYAASKLASTKMFEYLQHERPDLRIFNLHPGVNMTTGLASKAGRDLDLSWLKQDTLQLSGNFMVWLSSPLATFLKGRFLYANWDVAELQEQRESFEQNASLLTTGLLGWT